jgi:hypothetical protein
VPSDPTLPPESEPAGPPGPGAPAAGRPVSAVTVLAGLLALVVLVGAALAWSGWLDEEPGAAPQATRSPDAARSTAAVRTPSAEVVSGLLDERAAAVLAGNRSGFLAAVDPTQEQFFAAQSRLAERLAGLPFAEWRYQVVGTGPGLPPERAAVLPEGSAIVRVRLSYRLEGTGTQTDRDQYLTVVPRGGRWLLAGDSDGDAQDLATQRDLWDLGPVRWVRGEHALVLADERAAGRGELRRLAADADQAVEDVDRLWREQWPRTPVVLLPRTQKDMALLIGSDGKGLAQIAAVTTGGFEEGVSRGDRIVINPEAYGTLGALGRQVVLSHEMTHVATRATTVLPLPIWLSEGFADYVAYDANPVPRSIVAADVFEAVREGDGPTELPDEVAFDASEGDVAVAYEAAWLAAVMIADRYGERRLVRFYRAMSDAEGPGWPDETEDVLGVDARGLTRDWRDFVAEQATR